MKNNILIWGVILIFLLSSLIPMTSSYETNKIYAIHIDDNGTLSGYVKDTSMNPIEGARVEVYFHETYEEDYSDSSGYYNVTNIPICYCLKNATVSKKGYRSECVLLSIDETTIHNFTLTRLSNTLYVGGSGHGNYSRIQDAVDNAPDGYTVFVYSGTYDDYFPGPYNRGGCVKIGKSIKLVGEDKYNTIINGGGNGHVVVINPGIENVSISGFTIQNSRNWDTGVNIYDKNKDIFIYDNIIMNNYQGIGSCFRGSNVKIYNNIISNNELGIKLLQSEHCSVYKNIISNNTNGIVLDGETAFIFIHHNQITDNEIGLWVDGSWGTIYSNNFISNEKHAYFSNLILFPFFLFHRQNWFENYWDNWKVRIPRPIRGDWAIVIFIVTHPYTFGPFPTFEFDWHPAKEPYDILPGGA